ncbi:MAG: hypothetical protein BIFFINMI_01524 [Phycisphaerae bacterium]|nr:hypothetical protein [Phycisphaerae bacterium]
MTHGLKKAWIWTKLGLIILVIAWVVLFLAKNWGKDVEVWLFFFAGRPSGPLSLVLLITAVLSIIAFWIIKKVVGVLHEFSEIREKDKTREREKKMEDLAKRVESRTPLADTPNKPAN